DYEALSRHSFMKAKRKKPLFPGKLKTPSGRIELYSEKMKQDGYPALPTHIPLESDDDFPLLFVPGPNHNFLNSTFSNNKKHVKLEKAPKLFIHTEDAVLRNIEDGETVRVWNHRGECELTVSVGEQVLPGVAVSQGLWADMDDKKQLVNSLTPDRLADMGGGAVFFSGKVQVEKLSNQNRPQ
ncbi:molybdopterin dinucleotide binding domain-containing protein, partial [Bacillus velezensis]